MIEAAIAHAIDAGRLVICGRCQFLRQPGAAWPILMDWHGRMERGPDECDVCKQVADALRYREDYGREQQETPEQAVLPACEGQVDMERRRRAIDLYRLFMGSYECAEALAWSLTEDERRQWGAGQ